MKSAKNNTNAANSIENVDNENTQAKSSSYESSFDTSFFYTNDKIINQLDNNEILATIQKKFPSLDQNSTDTIIKKTFIQLLDDEKFVVEILQYYNINIYELFKLVYRQYSSIFKGPYLKKIKNRIKDKKYATIRRSKTDY